MRRKDCEKLLFTSARRALERREPVRAWVATAVLLLVAAGANASDVMTVRLWPQAVVMGDAVKLSELAEVSGIDDQAMRALKELIITEAPRPGKSKKIRLDFIRSAIRAAGMNMALVTLKGVVECEVSRPSTPPEDEQSGETAPNRWTSDPGLSRLNNAAGSPASEPTPRTLRQAVIEFFDRELARYEGRAEVAFDLKDQQLLELEGPPYSFVVRRRGGGSLGRIQVDVTVLADGQIVQTVKLRPDVRMFRTVAVVRSAIDKDAIIATADMDMATVLFSRVNRIGMADASLVIGQRAKHALKPGSVIDPVDLEAVPLVTRGQIVTLTSIVGGVSVWTTGEAMAAGYVGELITVRNLDRRNRKEFEAMVVGPGRVEIRVGRPAAGNGPRRVGGYR